MKKFRSLDTPRHGWEGLSNSGEIYGNGDISESMIDEADRINELLSSTEESEYKNITKSIAQKCIESKISVEEYNIEEEYNYLISQGIKITKEEFIKDIFSEYHNILFNITFGDSGRSL